MERIPWELINAGMNIILLVGGSAVSLFLRGMRDNIQELKATDTNLSAKISAVEVMIAGHYITRQEFQHALEGLTKAIFVKLDKIDDRVATHIEKSDK